MAQHRVRDIEVDGEQLSKHQNVDERFDSDYFSYNSVTSSVNSLKSDFEFRKQVTQMSDSSKIGQLDSLQDKESGFGSLQQKESGFGSLQQKDSGFGSLLEKDDGFCEKSIDIPYKESVEQTQISDISKGITEIKLGHSSDRVTPEAMVVYGKDEDGDTLLNIAILEGQISLVMEFIKLAPGNVWLDIQNNDMWQTPLHLAALTHQTDIARRLLVGGADSEVQDCNGDTPLHIACRLGDNKMVSTLLSPIEFNETCVNEYKIPCRNIPQNLEIRNSNGYTCLHEAALNGHLNVVKTLISKGANVNTKECKCGATILHMVIDRNDIEMVVYIVSRRDANVDCKLYNGTTPMLLAHYRKNPEILEKLKSAGATFGNLSLTNSPNSSEDDDM